MKTNNDTKPWAVTDSRCYQALLNTGRLSERAVMMGMRLALTCVAEAQQGSGLNVICSEHSPERILEILRTQAAEYKIGIEVPQLHDSRCVLLPHGPADQAKLLDGYAVVVALGVSGIVATVKAAGMPAVDLV